MGVLTLKSTNPKLSYVISKNPASGPLVRKIRKGTATGRFLPKTDAYMIHFKDGDFQNSFSEEFDYLNGAQYFSPVMYNCLVEEYFKTIRNQGHTDDTPEVYDHEMVLEMTTLKPSTAIFRHLQTYPAFQVTYTDLQSGRYTRVSIKTKLSIQALLQFSSMLTLLAIFTTDDDYYVADDQVAKIIRHVKALELGYYVIYYISSRLIRGKEAFAKYKPLLEEHPTLAMTLNKGNTQEQRKDWIFKHGVYDLVSIEIGCGSGYYALPIAKRNLKHTYFAIDTDAEELSHVRRKADHKKLENIMLFNSFEEFLVSDEATAFRVPDPNDPLKNINSGAPMVAILMTEVLEHVEPHESIVLLTEVLKTLNWTSVVITMPNSEFNVHYNLQGMRHPDHKYEPTKTQFIQMIGAAMGNAGLGGYESEYHQVGDIVNGQSVSHGWELRR
jgi:hypothetical protein